MNKPYAWLLCRGCQQRVRRGALDRDLGLSPSVGIDAYLRAVCVRDAAFGVPDPDPKFADMFRAEFGENPHTSAQSDCQIQDQRQNRAIPCNFPDTGETTSRDWFAAECFLRQLVLYS
jgi:hypothetical protein